MSSSDNKRGFIAVVSVIILGFVLLMAVLTLSSLSVGSRFVLLDLERKSSSRELAEGCVQFAAISIVNDSSYAQSNYSVSVGDGDCTIFSVVPSSGQSVVRAKGVVGNATTNLEVGINHASGAIISWRELATLP